jgi:hypothetical protein
MAENYKHLYEQTKKMLTMYQDELIPGFRKQIEELETKNKWIPVSERLPEDDRQVLACTKKGKAFSAHYDHRWKSWSVSHTVKITHWMPLPEPPKEV